MSVELPLVTLFPNPLPHRVWHMLEALLMVQHDQYIFLASFQCFLRFHPSNNVEEGREV
jgi:hypothetical protein